MNALLLDMNAVILRELGGEPPATDLIVWLWKGRPAPDWGDHRSPLSH